MVILRIKSELIKSFFLNLPISNIQSHCEIKICFAHKFTIIIRNYLTGLFKLKYVTQTIFFYAGDINFLDYQIEFHSLLFFILSSRVNTGTDLDYFSLFIHILLLFLKNIGYQILNIVILIFNSLIIQI